MLRDIGVTEGYVRGDSKNHSEILKLVHAKMRPTPQRNLCGHSVF
jgi:hypothetical protein